MLKEIVNITSLKLTILVPEPSISIIIGRNESQINKIQERSYTEIKVLDRTQGSLYRKIEIEGRPIDIEAAVKYILILVKDYNASPLKTKKKEFRSKLKFLLSNIKEKTLMPYELKSTIEKNFNIQIKSKIIEKNREYDSGLMLVRHI